MALTRSESELSDAVERPVPPSVELSVVIPLYNEEESIDLAVAEVLQVLHRLSVEFELILVNDGSTDATGAKALAWHDVDPRVKVIEFRRNFGQTAGISAGFDYAAGRVVVVMDGDQQNDPADIPTLLAALEQGYDVASGWRADRKDKFLSRRLPSKVANALISRVTGLELHDYGCTLKAYDKEVIEHLELFGELHRFIPALALISGAKVIEIPVNHRARERGSSKYGISRMPRVVLDLLTVKFLIGYRQKPMQFFGRVAFVCVAAAGVSALWSGSRLIKRAPHQSGVATIFALASLQFASFGLIGELLTRVYFKDAAHRPYVVRSATGEDTTLVQMLPRTHESPRASERDPRTAGESAVRGDSIPIAVEPARAASSRRIAPMTVVRITVTAGAFALIAHKIGFGAVVHALARANPLSLAVGYAIAVVTILLTVWQWNGLATANGVARTYRRCLHLELGGDVFDAALPSSIGGDFVRATSLAETPEERVPAAASVVLRRLCNFPGMIVIAAIGLAATVSLGYADRIRPFALGVVAGGLGLVVLALSPAMGFIGRWGLLRRGPGRAVAKLLNTLHEFRGQRRHLVRATLRGLLFWTVVVASQSMFIRALGIHIPLMYSALVITTATGITMLPISLGGYGLREGAFAAFLAAGGHATAAQGAAVGVCITVQMLALGVIGIPFYLTIRTRRSRPAAYPAPRPAAMEAA